MTTSPTPPPSRLDRRRYLRVVAFLLRVFLHVGVCDVVGRRVAPRRARATAERRWRDLARRYRALAVSLGGLQIKLGQFLSIRVDVLPTAITSELAGLQDEVPPESFAAVLSVVEAAFGRPVDEVFAWIDPAPLGSASLAQVHRARLPDGTPVVVKVQRPRIETLVETDLAAFRFGIGLLGRLGWIRRRADLQQLYEEFARTTRAELDFEAEGRHAEAFAADFADDPTVWIPTVHWPTTRATVLTLEEIRGIKVTDIDALTAAGVDRGAVARKLVDAYFQQVFVHNFVHADPHPGNLFVAPGADHGFRLGFVDFGMVAVVPERLRAHLRELLIGLATRDERRAVSAIAAAGLLLPGADQRRIEEAMHSAFERFWDVSMGDLRDVSMSQAAGMALEFADVIRDAPFQLPADLLFVGRAMGILSGLATALDPGFVLWAALEPYAARLSAEAVGARSPELARLTAELVRLAGRVPAVGIAAGLVAPTARSLLGVPVALERVLREVERGELAVRVEPVADLQREIAQLRRTARGLTWAIAFAGLVIAGAVVQAAGGAPQLAGALFGGAIAALALALIQR